MRFNEGVHMEIRNSRCINQLHNGVACSYCAQHCPTNAIVIQQGRVKINTGDCGGCGSCFVHCPTEVFSSEMWDEQTIVDTVLQNEEPVVQLFCGMHPRPDGIQVPACLAILSKTAFFQIGAEKTIRLRLDACETCGMNRCMPFILRNVGLAQEMLNACGKQPEIYEIKEGADISSNEKCKAIVTGERLMSRRDFFLYLRNQGGKIWEGSGKRAKKSSEEILRSIREGNEYSLLPVWAKKLNDSYERTYEKYKGGKAAYWPSIDVTQSCMNCGTCSCFCPTGALHVEIEGDICTHYFTAGLCADCRLCQLACPLGSINREYVQEEQPFVKRLILSGEVTACKRCNSLIYLQKGSLCHWCGSEPSVNDIISDIKSNLLKNAKK